MISFVTINGHVKSLNFSFIHFHFFGSFLLTLQIFPNNKNKTQQQFSSRKSRFQFCQNTSEVYNQNVKAIKQTRENKKI